jgi:hypothetical protein
MYNVVSIFFHQEIRMAGFLCLLAGFLQRLIAMSYRGGEKSYFSPGLHLAVRFGGPRTDEEQRILPSG